MDGPKRGINRKVWQAGEVGQSGGSETLVTVLEPSMRAGGGQRGALDRTERARLHSGRFSLAKGGEGSLEGDPWGGSVWWSRPERVVPPTGLWLGAWRGSMRTS